MGTDATEGKGFDHQTPGGNGSNGGGKGSKGGVPLQAAGAVTCVALRGEVLSLSLSRSLSRSLSLSFSFFSISLTPPHYAAFCFFLVTLKPDVE